MAAQKKDPRDRTPKAFRPSRIAQRLLDGNKRK